MSLLASTWGGGRTNTRHHLERPAQFERHEERFAKIAAALVGIMGGRKKHGDVVQFYYKNKKTAQFTEEVRQRRARQALLKQQRAEAAGKTQDKPARPKQPNQYTKAREAAAAAAAAAAANGDPPPRKQPNQYTKKKQPNQVRRAANVVS
jgi:hypothetical protein